MSFRYMPRFVLLLGCAMVLACTIAPPVRAGDPQPPEPLRVTEQGGDLRLSWGARPSTSGDPGARLRDWPLVEVAGVMLPAQLVTVQVAGAGPVVPRLERLNSTAWHYTPVAAVEPIPRTEHGDLSPELAVAGERALPASPVFLLREGRMRGVRIAVLAVTPVYDPGDGVRLVHELAAVVPGAATFEADAADLLAAREPFVVGAPAPTNPAALTPAWKVLVTRAGIQRLPGAALATAGLDLSTIDPADLCLRHQGRVVRLERYSAGELRFYAPEPGDRWNDADTYWLTVEPGSCQLIGARSVAPGAATERTTAWQRGVWRESAYYDSLRPGPDGDHWFAADLRADPGDPPDTPPLSTTITVTPALTLPLATGPARLVVHGTPLTFDQHRLQAQIGSSTAEIVWAGREDWAHALILAESGSRFELRLLPSGAFSQVRIDRVEWEFPIELDVAQRGAAFEGVAGTWRYQVRNLPGGAALYDVSDPLQPVRLTGMTTAFEDSASGDGHSYLLAGPGTLHTPQVSAHDPVDLQVALDATALYIAPRAFHAALEPLVIHRRAQGHAVAVVDVQAVYDAWSYGAVAPEAIRAFLRYAASTGIAAPAAVVLVGDGTRDPHGYTGYNNPNHIPPYLAMVDPWVRETACEPCYAQLDGEGPLSDRLPDLAIGRLPVKSIGELEALVDKLLAYEAAPHGAWRSRVVYIADNYRERDGTIDGAGDFANHAEKSIAALPAGMHPSRLYYDPTVSSTTPWREPDPIKAHQRAIEQLGAGAGLALFFGHSSYWEWGSNPYIDEDGARQLEPLFSLYDTLQLQNAAQLPIVLGMTCLTGAFHVPSFSGLTLDELLLLHANGGAAGVWGPTGLGVAHGHQQLQHGFITALGTAPAGRSHLGGLTLAGYLELYTTGGCCQDALRTFALLGDPLTIAQAAPDQQVFLPALQR